MNEIIVDGLVAVGSILVANYGIKLGRVYPLLKSANNYIKVYLEAKKDGKLTQAEKADLFDKINEFVTGAWSILKGIFPNKSK